MRRLQSYRRREPFGMGSVIGFVAVSAAMAAAIYFGPELARYIKAERM